MAAQFITLDEAAKRLGIPIDEFKRRLKTEWTHLVPMRDGPTLRFRDNQIDELGRQLGAASDPARCMTEASRPRRDIMWLGLQGGSFLVSRASRSEFQIFFCIHKKRHEAV